MEIPAAHGAFGSLASALGKGIKKSFSSKQGVFLRSGVENQPPSSSSLPVQGTTGSCKVRK